MNSRRLFLLALTGTNVATLLAAPSVEGRGTCRMPRRRATPRRPLPSYKFPDPIAWDKVIVGMSHAEVTRLLGAPSSIEPVDERHEDHVYGSLAFNSPAFPRSLEFVIMFSDGRVHQKEDPFGGTSSPRGLPTTPQLLLPKDNESLGHYPRFLDLRWQLSAGRYPVYYQVDVSHTALPLREHSPSPTIEILNGISDFPVVESPFLTTEFVGRGQGRWRVRAFNSLGASDWSEVRKFRFSV